MWQCQMGPGSAIPFPWRGVDCLVTVLGALERPHCKGKQPYGCTAEELCSLHRQASIATILVCSGHRHAVDAYGMHVLPFRRMFCEDVDSCVAALHSKSRKSAHSTEVEKSQCIISTSATVISPTNSTSQYCYHIVYLVVMLT